MNKWPRFPASSWRSWVCSNISWTCGWPRDNRVKQSDQEAILDLLVQQKPCLSDQPAIPWREPKRNQQRGPHVTHRSRRNSTSQLFELLHFSIFPMTYQWHLLILMENGKKNAWKKMHDTPHITEHWEKEEVALPGRGNKITQKKARQCQCREPALVMRLPRGEQKDARTGQTGTATSVDARGMLNENRRNN